LRELALHLLDVIENSVRAQATVIRVSVLLDSAADTLTLRLEDDGPGLSITPEQVLDPFYTTKKGKRTGLGLSLLRAAAEQAGGGMSLSRSEFGGLQVEASFKYAHVDRAPLGDVAATIKSIALSNPQIVWICCIEGPGDAQTLILQDFMDGNQEKSLFTIMEEYGARIEEVLRKANISTG
jgi:hypothetical protein